MQGEHGALDPERTADELDKRFYRPLYAAADWAAGDSLYMDELPFDPKDHASRSDRATFQRKERREDQRDREDDARQVAHPQPGAWPLPHQDLHDAFAFDRT